MSDVQPLLWRRDFKRGMNANIFLCIVSYSEHAYAEGWCCFPCKYDEGF